MVFEVYFKVTKIEEEDYKDMKEEAKIPNITNTSSNPIVIKEDLILKDIYNKRCLMIFSGSLYLRPPTTRDASCFFSS